MKINDTFYENKDGRDMYHAWEKQEIKTSLGRPSLG
jgi:hypothetical protein